MENAKMYELQFHFANGYRQGNRFVTSAAAERQAALLRCLYPEARIKVKPVLTEPATEEFSLAELTFLEGEPSVEPSAPRTQMLSLNDIVFTNEFEETRADWSLSIEELLDARNMPEDPHPLYDDE